MRSTRSKKLLAAVLATVMVMGAAFGGAGAAPPTVNDGTLDAAVTTGTELQDGTTVGANHSFAANDSTATVLSYQADSNSSEVTMAHNDTGTVVYTNASADLVDWNSTDNDGIFNVSINHGDLADLERAINDNVSIDVTMVNDTGADPNNETVFQAYIESDNSTAVENVESNDTDDDGIAEVVDTEFSVAGINFSIGSFGADDFTRIQRTGDDDVAVNGSDTDVVIVASDTDVVDDFDATTEDAEDEESLSQLSRLGPRMAAIVSTDDTTVPVPIFSEAAPDSVDDDTTHGVVQDVGGETAIVFNLGDSFDDADAVDVELVANAGLTTMFWEYTRVGISNSIPVLWSGGLFDGLAGASLGLLAGAPAARRSGVA